MTPELQAAIQRVRSFATELQRNADTGDSDARVATVHVARREWAHLMLSDVLALLAALDPADQPIDRIPTQRGLDYLRDRRQQHPRGAE